MAREEAKRIYSYSSTSSPNTETQYQNFKFKAHNSKPNTWLQYSTCLEKLMSWCLHDNKGSYKMQRKKERSRLDHGCIDEMGPIDSGHCATNSFLCGKGGQAISWSWKRGEGDHILIGLHWIGCRAITTANKAGCTICAQEGRVLFAMHCSQATE